VPVCRLARHAASPPPIPPYRPRRYPSDTTDAEWALLEPLLPAPASVHGRGGRPEAHHRRDIVDAIRYVTHNGCVWRALPCDFPPWRTVYGFYWRWNASGATSTLHDQLRTQVRLVAGPHPIPSAAIIDSQSVRAADTVPKQSRGYDAAKGQRAETPPCGGYPGAAAGDRGHRRQRPRPRRRPAAAVPAAPWRPRHPVGLGRCRLRGQAGHLGKVDPALAAGHCPSAPGTRLRGPAAPLGHRADLRLAQPVSPHRPRLRAAARPSPSDGPVGDDHPHGGRSG
jgi:transposase